MSQIKNLMMTVMIIAAGMLLLSGCGDRNTKVPYSEESGHPAGWLPSGHAAAAKADGSATCEECHGSDLSGGISGVACTSCHVNGSPFEHTDCTSCHGNPPSGSDYPNIEGAHNSTGGHFSAGVTLAQPNSCDTCHNGAGIGTKKHDNGTVDVALLSAVYSAKSGTAVYNGDGTCSEVSCHGGQTTPNWYTGSINAKTQCTLCHAYGTSEYNSYSSGQHDFHVNTQGIHCTACHNTTTLATAHFTSLDTPAFGQQPSATIGGIPNTLVTDYTGGNCTNDCHVTRAWF